MTHTWNIERVQYQLSNGRISHLHWRLVSADATNSVETHGSVKLLYGDNDPVSVPFSNVTVQIARDWLSTRMGVEQSQVQTRNEERLSELTTATTNISAIS